jgi:hypothetical protein
MNTPRISQITLPKKNDIIVIPKGVLVNGTPSKRAQKVKVHHILGRSYWIVGYQQRNGEPRLFCSSRDLISIENVYGTQDLETLYLENKMEVMNESIYLPMNEPKIRWPGSGGYWKSASIYDINPQ